MQLKKSIFYLHRLDDVKSIVDKMEKCVRFKITATRDNEVIKRLYCTRRGKLLFSLPPKVKTVSISKIFIIFY